MKLEKAQKQAAAPSVTSSVLSAKAGGKAGGGASAPSKSQKGWGNAGGGAKRVKFSSENNVRLFDKNASARAAGAGDA